MKKLLITLLILSAALWTSAQGNAQVAEQQATGMRANGKIYVVLAVALTILTGLIVYVITLDRKISRLEKGDHKAM